MINITLPAVGALTGYLIGSYTIDSILSGRMNRIKRSIVCAMIAVILFILGAVSQPELRIVCIITISVLLLGIAAGLFLRLMINPTLGLTRKWKGECIRDLVFDRQRPETGYDLYLPPEKNADGTYALVLYIHGGGFSSGDKREGKHWCRHMAMRGYVAASVNYTLARPDQESSLPFMVDQILTCVSALKSECLKRGYCLTEMTVTGISAGGCLAALYAYGKALVSPIPVKFLFEETGPVYFHPLWWRADSDRKTQAAFLTTFSGRQITEEEMESDAYMTAVEEISAACMVRDDSVPSLLAYGPNDGVVPPALKFMLLSALEKHHIPYAYVEFPNSNHGMYHDPKEQRIYVKKVDEFCKTWFDHKPKTK